jgi:hypothetical protein
MKKQKKPLQSKPAAKKKAASKAVRNPQLLAPGLAASLPNWVMFDSQLIDGIAARVEELAAQLKRVDQKLDVLLVHAAPLKREDWHPLIVEAEKALDLDRETQ